MNISELVTKAHENAVDHGFWEPPLEFGTAIALIHSELSEALEEVRAGNPTIYKNCTEDGRPCEGHTCDYWETFDGSCKNGTIADI